MIQQPVKFTGAAKLPVRLADMTSTSNRDIVSDIAGSFHTMVVGDARQMNSTRSEPSTTVSTLTQNPRLPNAPSTRARNSSYTAVPNQATKPRSSTGKPHSISQHVGPAATVSVPTSQHAPSNRFHRDPPPYEARGADDSDEENGYDRNGFPLSSTPRGLAATPPSPRLQPQNRSVLSFTGSGAPSPSRIKVRDLSHIQSFASEEVLARSRHGSRYSMQGRQEGGQQYEISSMPVTDIIEMVAGLLTKITTNNDRQHEHLHRSIPPPEGTTGLTQQATSVLAFHGKNVPSITILSYLSRIHKYCPTTYEVFLSLVVYFDRMTQMVNNEALRDYHISKQKGDDGGSPRRAYMNGGHSAADPIVVSIDEEEDLVDSDDEESSSPILSSLHSDRDAFNLSQFFIVDSFNIHRLVIAGVTCASKFFSDVFYTNSRYAKVGGLPLIELNHLELQFLLLNDFRLSVPVEELEAYGTMLVEFYAREVLSQQQQQQKKLGNSQPHAHGPNNHSEDLYMQTTPTRNDGGVAVERPSTQRY